MTSISALSTHHHQHTSPLQRLQDELQSEVSSDTISASDQSALSSALDDIDSSLQSDGTSDQPGSGSGPDGIKSRIDSLIQQEVSSGKLTDQQATELQGIFKSAFAHGPGGAGGPPPFNAPPPVGGTDSSSSGTNTSSSGNSTADLLEKFLDSLKASLADSTYSGSGSNGTSNPSDPSLSNVLLNDRI
ncbi:hypothetical protein ABIC09_006983 [Bradyrhizobium sp. S3.12.5]|uniref:hypothetical protein n=1 Tax=Bradyrhizobium sp. S3.12.5 TaxID=3156386 RepID=UPI0033951075